MALHRALRRMAGLVFHVVFWVLAGACQRGSFGRFIAHFLFFGVYSQSTKRKFCVQGRNSLFSWRSAEKKRTRAIENRRVFASKTRQSLQKALNRRAGCAKNGALRRKSPVWALKVPKTLVSRLRVKTNSFSCGGAQERNSANKKAEVSALSVW